MKRRSLPKGRGASPSKRELTSKDDNLGGQKWPPLFYPLEDRPHWLILGVRHMSDTRKKRKGNPRVEFRLHPLNHAYLDDILKDGSFGGSKSEIVRRFVEEGIRRARNEVKIPHRDIADHGGPTPSED
jgi:hypothetical protein